MQQRPTKSQVETVEVELLPPEKESHSLKGILNGQNDALPRLIALFMDNLFSVPGTKIRFGVNPLLDLLPVVGDGAAAAISALTLFTAARYRVPKVVLVRMGGNILLNGLIGIIPGVGELFAFWYRPSMRNYRLLQKHLAEHDPAKPASTSRDWFFVTTLIAGVLILFALCIGAGAYLFFSLLRGLSSN